MKKILIPILLLLSPVTSFSADTAGYVQIGDLKAFSTYLSIYLIDGQTHTCGGSPNSRFQSDAGNNHYTSFLLSAFATGKGVNLKYSCSGSTALINGIRLNVDS